MMVHTTLSRAEGRGKGFHMHPTLSPPFPASIPTRFEELLNLTILSAMLYDSMSCRHKAGVNTMQLSVPRKGCF